MKYFNTAGPCDPEYHYMLPASERLSDARELIDEGGYFAVHAPRQTGKTTTLRALSRALTAEGRYAALRFSCETGEPAGDNYVHAQHAVLDDLRRRAQVELPPELRPPEWPASGDLNILREALSVWASQCPRPLVLFFDEIDALQGESLRAVLRQLRAGFDMRPKGAPWSVVLCGLRDVREYKVASGGDPTRLGTSSPFNIKIKSLRLGDFSREDVRALYAQHAAATGQVFAEGAVDAAFEASAGQPWLVNALAREVTKEMKIPVPTTIEVDHVDTAKERLILARATHLDSLVARLMEPRVRAVIEPLLAGADNSDLDAYDDNIGYVRDLGLIAIDRPIRIANPIYREVIVRVLGVEVQDKLDIEPRSFILPDGRFDLKRMLEEFAEFWRQQGDVFSAKMPYHEVAPQLVMMAFLQRVVNGGGYVEREYGVGRGRIDLIIRWPLPARGEWQREAIELKVWREGRPDPLEQGLTQLQGYLNRLGLETGTLVIFDRRSTAGAIDQRTHFDSATLPNGATATVLRA